MKSIKIFGLAGLIVLANFFTNCSSLQNANNTQKGAGIGVAAVALIKCWRSFNWGSCWRCCRRINR